MKSRLNVTIDSVLLEKAKRHAARNNSSLSRMIEVYFKSLSRPAHKKTAIDLLRKLPKPKKATIDNLKQDYYQQRKKKYGF
jgi:hypothetical protein